MATVEETVHETTKDAVDISHHNLLHYVDKVHKMIGTLPLHTHANVIKMLQTLLEQRGQAMQLEAMEQQKKAQEAFEADRKRQDEALKAARQQAENQKQPQLVV